MYLQLSRLGRGPVGVRDSTATGCALTAVVGAFAAVARADAYTAAVAALSCFGIAGRRAAQRPNRQRVSRGHWAPPLARTC
ncbi:hydroxyethylthiazole kinase [Achromobacter ruhlandii]|uniref:hydroxyethylthiazole kinase n=1 Tax=Achromobacter ruhlandii TaxID=72557 RepID=UPI003211A9F9